MALTIRQRARSLLAAALALGIAVAAPAVAAAAEEAVYGEYQIKAAFLKKFVKFVEWPSRPSGTLTLCIFGEDPFREALQGTDNVGGGRYLAYRRIDNLQETGDCQVLFVARGKNKIIPEIVAAVEGQEVLTIGDGEGLAEAGLMISFVHVDRKVRFEANLERARRARLMISSQLLSLALTVYNPR